MQLVTAPSTIPALSRNRAYTGMDPRGLHAFLDAAIASEAVPAVLRDKAQAERQTILGYDCELIFFTDAEAIKLASTLLPELSGELERDVRSMLFNHTGDRGWLR